MTSTEIQSTWATRELPILVTALRRLDGGDDDVPLEEIRHEVGLSTTQLKKGVEALEEAGYIEVSWAMGWRPDRATGEIDTITERTRRDLGSWPTPASIVDEIVRALLEQADRSGPEQNGRLRAAAEILAGGARDIAVAAAGAQLGQL